jgi:hypothetical protein
MFMRMPAHSILIGKSRPFSADYIGRLGRDGMFTPGGRLFTPFLWGQA